MATNVWVRLRDKYDDGTIYIPAMAFGILRSVDQQGRVTTLGVEFEQGFKNGAGPVKVSVTLGAGDVVCPDDAEGT